MNFPVGAKGRIHAVALVVGCSVLASCERRTPPPTAQAALSVDLLTPEGTCSSESDRVSRAVAWVLDSSIALIDSDRQQILVCGIWHGKSQYVGRKGPGPGEMTGAFAITASAGGALAIADAALRRVTVWDSAAKLRRIVRIPGFPAQLLAWNASSIDVVWLDPGATTRPVVGRVASAGEQADSLFSLAALDSVFGDVPSTSPSGPVFAVGSNGKGQYFVARTDMYRVAVTDSAGRLIRVMGRPEFPIEHYSQAEVESKIRLAMFAAGANGPRVPPAGISELAHKFVGTPKPVMGAQSLAVDEEGQLWVVTTRYSGDSTEVDVFGPSGALRASLSLRDTVHTLALHAGQLAVVVSRGSVRESMPPVDVYSIGRTSR